MTNHAIVYACLCSDAAEHLDAMPDRCPGHDQPRTGHWPRPPLPGGIRAGHECPEDIRTCPTQGDPA